jgi:hypothetical protein
MEISGNFEQLEIFRFSHSENAGIIRRGEVGRFVFLDGSSLYFAWEPRNNARDAEHPILQWDCNVSDSRDQDCCLQFSTSQVLNRFRSKFMHLLRVREKLWVF